MSVDQGVHPPAQRAVLSLHMLVRCCAWRFQADLKSLQNHIRAT